MILPRGNQFPGESRLHVLLPAIIIPEVIAFLFVIARVVSRIRLMKIWGWDDSLIILACLNSMSSMILFSISTSYGLGYHVSNVPETLLRKSLKLDLIPFINYQLSLCLTKLSILAFYLGVFPSRREKWMTRGTIVVVVAFSIPLVICTALSCSPAGTYPFNPSIKCVSYKWIGRISTSFHTISDAWLILMIVPVLSTLRIPSRQKYALMGVLSLGVFVIAIAIARAITLTKVFGGSDITWIMIDVCIWTTWESSIGIVCACAPTIRPVLKRIFPNFMTSYSGGSDARVYGGTEFNKAAAGTRGMPGAIELGSQTHSTTLRIAKGRNQDRNLNKNESEEDIILKQQDILKRADFTVSALAVHTGTSIDGKEDRLTQTRSETDSLEGGLEGRPG